MTTQNAIKLVTGNFMPKIGLGTWRIPEIQCNDIINNAIKSQYKLIDCAASYRNEKAIGTSLNNIFKQQIINRDDTFITSKLYNTDHKKDDVKLALKRTLKDLKLDYLDLYLMHFPVAWPNIRTNDDDYVHSAPMLGDLIKGKQEPITIFETWLAMEELVKEGLVKDIGVSNFNCALIWELTKINTVPISVNQVEIHPYLQQQTLVELCQSMNITITGYSSFGDLQYSNAGEYKGNKILFNEEIIQNIADKYQCTPSQVLLSWALNRNIAVIPKSSKMDRMIENLQSINIILNDDDMKLISQLECNLRFNDTQIKWGTPIFD